MQALFVHWGLCYPQSTVSFPSWSFSHPPWSVCLPQNCGTESPKTAWWKQRDWYWRSAVDDSACRPQFFGLLGLHIWQPSTASGVKLENSRKFEFQRDLAGRYRESLVLSSICPCAHKSHYLKPSSNFFLTLGVETHSSCTRPHLLLVSLVPVAHDRSHLPSLQGL